MPQPLHDARTGQVPLNELARRGARVVEVGPISVGAPPVVHRVDDQRAAHFLSRQRSVAAERKRQYDGIRHGHEVGDGHRLRPDRRDRAGDGRGIA
ncbi:hypothetical protein BFN01_07310 [Microbacterium sp. AR7-10]|nr:hypothetical protein BFN01_07310 [Microbacterium sp. AR7-10]